VRKYSNSDSRISRCYSRCVRRLIINADDLGLTAGVNRGIMEAHSQGVVTSTTLMANARAFDGAVNTLAARKSASREQGGTEELQARRLSVGCHVLLVDGDPVLPKSQVSTLLRNAQAEGFRDSLEQLMWAIARGRVDLLQVEAEAAAQMRKIQASGVQLSHFDTHKHVHLLPSVLRPLLRAARACGVRAVRNPFAPIKPLAFAHLLRRPHLWTRYSEVKLLRGWAATFRRSVADAGLVTTDGSFGIVVTGALDETLFRAIIGCIPEGTWELVCHPGYNDAELNGVRTRLRSSREQELKVLTSPRVRPLLDEHGIELISYWDLQGDG
jgi:predicted glycoside hydrolase/deacetylase ChbG (UPF0249 family)